MNTLIIDDNYFKDNYPLPFTVDTKRLAAVISFTQRIHIREMLGDSLYQAVIDWIADGEDENSPIYKCIDDIRLLHCFYVARALFTSYYKDGEKEIREFNISYIDGNIETLKTYLVNNVVGNAEIYDIASEAEDNQFNEDTSNYSLIYFREDEE
jgi:hypothetical protein